MWADTDIDRIFVSSGEFATFKIDKVKGRMEILS